MSLIKHQKDFWAGVLYIAFGGTAILIALDYPLGTANRMGPGYFPRGLGFLLIGLGLILLLRSFKLRGAPIHFPSFKPISDRAGQRRCLRACRAQGRPGRRHDPADRPVEHREP